MKKQTKSGTRLYHIWDSMKQRCNNPNNRAYKDYGGRGISVCDEWLNSFEAFYEWAVANGYAENLTIDRKDNNGNYEPDNCRWATAKEQANNRRTSDKYELNGKTKTLKEWCEEKGLSYKVVHRRISNGWNFERAITETDGHNTMYITYNGVTKTLTEWANELGINKATLHARLKYRGWTVEKAFSKK